MDALGLETWYLLSKWDMRPSQMMLQKAENGFAQLSNSQPACVELPLNIR
jgi:hypothetical protein